MNIYQISWSKPLNTVDRPHVSLHMWRQSILSTDSQGNPKTILRVEVCASNDKNQVAAAGSPFSHSEL